MSGLRFAPWLLAAALAACSSKTILTPIGDEPTCPDYEVGAAKTPMKGGLEHPVQVTVRDKKGNQVARVVVFGLRAGGTPTKIGLPDGDGDYTVEWGVCPNARATEAVGGENQKKDPYAVPYQCGDAKVYATAPLSTKKNDPSTHALAFAPTPDAKCLVSQLPPAPPPPPPVEVPPSATAPAPPPPEPPASASGSSAPSGAAPPASASARASASAASSARAP